MGHTAPSNQTLSSRPTCPSKLAASSWWGAARLKGCAAACARPAKGHLRPKACLTLAFSTSPNARQAHTSLPLSRCSLRAGPCSSLASLKGARPHVAPGGWHSAALVQRTVQCKSLRVQNYELLIGDVVLLVSFALWKQLAGIVLSPDFPGWLAPLAFKPTRFAEFLSFAITLCGVWVSATALIGGYEARATKDLPTTLRITSYAWLASMPVAAAQLVLTTALASRALVGDDDFGLSLPLAASGVGEPFSTAAGVLGLMAAWRAYYCVYLDWWTGTTAFEAARLQEAFKMAGMMSVLSLVVLQGLSFVLATFPV